MRSGGRRHDEPGQEGRRQRVVGRGDAEGEGGHRQEGTLDPQRRHPDDEGHHRPDQHRDDEGGEQVPAVVGIEQRGGRPAQAGDAELAQGDLPRPPGEDEEGEADYGVDHDDRRQVGLAVAQDERQGGGQRQQHDLAAPQRPAHLGQPGQRPRDRAHRHHGLPGGALGLAPRERLSLKQEGHDDDDEQGGVDEGGVREGPRRPGVEDADGDGGDGGPGHVVHAPDHGGGQRSRAGSRPRRRSRSGIRRSRAPGPARGS